MNRSVKIFSGLALALAMLFSATACTTTEAIDTTSVTAVIDVRTVEEFNAGHIEGALHIPVERGDFAENISQLDPEGNYLVYCRSGRRSGLAIEQMTELGFKNLSNLGSLENASSVTQIPIVQ